MKRTKTEAKTTREGHEVATPRLSNMKRGQSCSRNQGSCHQKATGARRAEEYSRCRHLPEILRLSQLRLLWSTFGGLLPLIYFREKWALSAHKKTEQKKSSQLFLGTDTSPFGGSNPSIPKDKIKIQQNPENQHPPKTPNAQGEACAESAHITAQRRPSRDRSRHQSAATQSDQKQPAPVRPAGASR